MGVGGGHSLTATPTELILPIDPVELPLFRLLTEDSQLNWVNGYILGSPKFIYDAYDAASPFRARWSTYITQAPGQDAWLIASTSTAAVPEPASLYLLGLGAVCGSVYVMGHKRRARRTAATTDA